jgi:4'-phosphopantetheinyl transferase
VNPPEKYRPANEHPDLGPAAVHVWRVALDAAPDAIARLGTTLSPDERARAERFHFDLHRHRYIAGRAMLRQLLGLYSGAAPADISFRYGSRGKPELASPPSVGDLRFNVAHSGDLALFAFAWNRPVGIDVEQVRDVPEAPTIARSHFTPAEARSIVEATGEELRERFCRIWTRKEAVIKAVGTGLAMPLTEFEVGSAMRSEPWEIVRLAAQQNATWAVRDLRPADGYAGAIAVADTAGEVSFWCADIA